MEDDARAGPTGHPPHAVDDPEHQIPDLSGAGDPQQEGRGGPRRGGPDDHDHREAERNGPHRVRRRGETIGLTPKRGRDELVGAGEGDRRENHGQKGGHRVQQGNPPRHNVLLFIVQD